MARITVKLEDDVAERLALLQHGFRGHLIASLLVLALDAIDKHGDIMIGAIISGEYKLVPNIKVHEPV